MTWRTMEEWNLKGKVVIKGSKCMLRDPEGVCLFSESQVKKKKRYSEGIYGPSDTTNSGYYKPYTQQGGNYDQNHDYDYDNYEFQ